MAEKIPNKINYTPVNWIENETPVSAENLGTMDVGVKSVTDAYNSLPSWVKNDKKPVYNATEVGADPFNSATNAVKAHLIDASAHTQFLSQIGHTHVPQDIVGLDEYVFTDTKMLNGKSADYYLDYNNLTNVPKEKTKLSQFENDSNYLTSQDIRLQLKGVYAFGYVDHQRVFSTPFAPVKVVVFEKTNISGGTVNRYEFTTDYVDDAGCSVLFQIDGFSIECPQGGMLNRDGYIYYWFALSIDLYTISVGPTGPAGVPGVSGKDGENGPVGPTGASGKIGNTGPTGASGEPGNIGPTGEQGPMGPTGAAGKDGGDGLAGPTGPIGAIGPTGPQGDRGADGAGISIKVNADACTQLGDAYIDSEGNLMILTTVSPKQFTNGGQIKGPQGEQGPTGDEGDIGPIGPTGPEGAIGPTGPQGDKGADGTGIAIKASETDCTVLGDAYVSSSGDLMILTSESPKQFTNGGQIRGPEGAMGPTGKEGPMGPTGASVTNGETSDNKVTEINENSTDEEYPSAKAVYDFVNSAITTALNTPV